MYEIFYEMPDSQTPPNRTPPAYENADFLNVINSYLKSRRKRVIYHRCLPLIQQVSFSS